MCGGCRKAGLVALVAIVAISGLLSTSFLASQTSALRPIFFGEINHAPILIDGDAGFTVPNGVRRGNGTVPDPFVISDWGILGEYGSYAAVTITNTRSSFVVFNVSASDG